MQNPEAGQFFLTSLLTAQGRTHVFLSELLNSCIDFHPRYLFLSTTICSVIVYLSIFPFFIFCCEMMRYCLKKAIFSHCVSIWYHFPYISLFIVPEFDDAANPRPEYLLSVSSREGADDPWKVDQGSRQSQRGESNWYFCNTSYCDFIVLFIYLFYYFFW